MARTHSEKVVEDTFRGLAKQGKLLWWHRFEAQIRGGRYRTPAPIDFIAQRESGSPLYLFEVKEVAGGSLGAGKFKPEQRRILAHSDAAWVIARFYNPDARRGSLGWWEWWFAVWGAAYVGEDQKGWSLTATGLAKTARRERKAGGAPTVIQLARAGGGVGAGLDAAGGVGGAGGPTMGLPLLDAALTTRAGR